MHFRENNMNLIDLARNSSKSLTRNRDFADATRHGFAALDPAFAQTQAILQSKLLANQINT